MVKLVNNKIFLVLSILLLIGGVYFFVTGGFLKIDYRKKVAEAMTYNPATKTGHKMSGFAYSETFGWISFNSSDTGSPINYGVNINRKTGTTTGFAWSENAGWIAFQSVTVCSNDNTRACNVNADCFGPGICGADASFPGYGFAAPAEGDCALVCTAAEKCTACYNRTKGKIYGWAKVVSLGNDGWIKLQKFSTDAGGSYGLNVDPATMYVTNWAWNGNIDPAVGLGWISFSCVNDGSCATSGYRVKADVGNIPIAGNFSTSTSELEFCNDTVLLAHLKWRFTDIDASSSPTAYRVVLTDYANPLLPVLDTGKCTESCYSAGVCDVASGATQAKCKIPPDCSTPDCQYNIHDSVLTPLDYGHNYNWSVEVWDDDDLSSGLTPANKDIRLFPSELPDPYFSMSPEVPSLGEETVLSGYENPPLCDTFGPCAYTWSTQAGTMFYFTPTASSTGAKFLESTSVAKLRIALPYGGCSTTSPAIVYKKRLPNWIETK